MILFVREQILLIDDTNLYQLLTNKKWIETLTFREMGSFFLCFFIKCFVPWYVNV